MNQPPRRSHVTNLKGLEPSARKRFSLPCRAENNFYRAQHFRESYVLLMCSQPKVCPIIKHTLSVPLQETTNSSTHGGPAVCRRNWTVESNLMAGQPPVARERKQPPVGDTAKINE